MRARLIVIGLAAIAFLAFVQLAVKAAPGEGSAPLLYTATQHYEPLAWMHGADRFTGATVVVLDSKGKHALVPDFAASADAAVSFDGQRVLFAGKKQAADRWQVWEIALAGGEPRRVSSGSEDCVRPFYLAEDRVVYARKVAGRFAIEVTGLEGGKTLGLTYGPASYFPTGILRDGRILFEAGYPLGGEDSPEIYTVYADGSGVESYRCDHGTARYEGREVSSGEIVFAARSGLSRFTSARAQAEHVSAPPGEYAGGPEETASGDWILPWRRSSGAEFQLMRWKPGAATMRDVSGEHGLDAVQPVLLAEHAVAKRHPSGLHDWPNANLLCLSAYTSKFQFQAGSVHAVRLYTRDGAGKPQLLGGASVERDGSFFVQVPTERPIQVELVDGAGKILQREAGFFWMRRGEQRVCVGCHAGPETAPENAVPMILLKSTTPADLTGAAARGAPGGN